MYLAFHLAGSFKTLQRNAIYYQGICHSLRTICRDEGFFGLYKGLGATLLVCLFALPFIYVDQSLASSEKEKEIYNAN